MRLIYQAQNSVEAHLLLNLFKQAGLKGRIDGEYLQGGIGELQVSGIVRVMIVQEDYQQAKEIVKQWETHDLSEQSDSDEASNESLNSQEPITSGNESIKELTNHMLNYLVVGLIGMFIGIALSYFYFQSPITENGIDYDGDGIPDEWWIYKNGLFAEGRIDRNLDKKIDYYYYYDHKGLLKSSKSDDDFDGVFESESKFKNNLPVWVKMDRTGDGYKNYKMNFKDGILDTIVFHNANKKIVKISYFKNLSLSYSEMDTNLDGQMDTRIEYDEFENPLLK